MCGIAGWIGSTSSTPGLFDRKMLAVKKIMEIQKHRGPDDNGIWEDRHNNVILGHNRLAILELSDAGAQPMVDNSGTWVISYNGELYNYKHLKKELTERFSITFKGNSDTEVVLYGIINLGIDEFLRKADGMFAFAIYNNSTKELLVARDRVGEKPLYFFKNDEGFSFASELRALLTILEEKKLIDPVGLHLYLLLRYVPPPKTIISGVLKLRPGFYLRFHADNESFEQIPYFSWDPHASEVPANQENYQTVVKGAANMLVQSLESRLMSDVPLGVFLSGGVDSSLCAALIRKFLGKNLNTYTIGFKGDSQSEHLVSEKTAKIIGSKHSAKIFDPIDLIDISSDLIKKLDGPNGDRSCIPTYLLCRHASSEVKVAIGGDGGDELFSGYSRYSGLNQRLGYGKFFNAAENLRAYFTFALPVFGSSISKIFDKDYSDEFISSLSTNLYSPVDFEQAIRFVDFKSYLPGAVLAKVDRTSMLSSLEVRTPFFAPNMLELCSRLPHQFLYRGKEMKPVLRDICRHVGLEHVANLPKKGFGMPAEFLNQNKEQLVKRAGLALKSLDSNPMVNEVIPDLGKKLAPFAGGNMNALWATIVLGEWFDSLKLSYVD